MPKLVVSGATLQCNQGLAPGKLTVIPDGRVGWDQAPVATVADHTPMVNVPAFGMCQTSANPQVAAATAAAMGTLTPQPCVPVLSAPWTPGSPTLTIGSEKALTSDSTCSCQWTGSISVIDPGPAQVDLE